MQFQVLKLLLGTGNETAPPPADVSPRARAAVAAAFDLHAPAERNM